jgi:hypothetical protein
MDDRRKGCPQPGGALFVEDEASADDDLVRRRLAKPDDAVIVARSGPWPPSAGETVIINGIAGAYGTAVALVAFAMGAGKVIGAGRNAARRRIFRASSRSMIRGALRDTARNGLTEGRSVEQALTCGLPRSIRASND